MLIARSSTALILLMVSITNGSAQAQGAGAREEVVSVEGGTPAIGTAIPVLHGTPVGISADVGSGGASVGASHSF